MSIMLKRGLTEKSTLSHHLIPRRDYALKVCEFSFGDDVARYSFLLRSISEWNALLTDIVSIENGHDFLLCFMYVILLVCISFCYVPPAVMPARAKQVCNK